MSGLIAISLLVVCTVFHHVTAETQRGFIMQSSRVLAQNSTNKITLQLYNVNAPGQVRILLFKKDNDSVIYAETSVDVGAGETDVGINLPVPEVSDYEADLQISGTFESEDNPDDVYKIYGQDTVNFQGKISPIIIFIQTDKPIYKPGQTVLFRVMVVDSNLKPVRGNKQCELWVEEPRGTRVAQWKNVSMDVGIVQREFQFSDEPNFGYWNFYASCDDAKESTSVRQMTYVPPKFEVTIDKPSYSLVTEKTITVEICGKYTYGKLVDGTVKINVTMETYSWSNDKFPTLEYEGPIEGCYKYDINVTALDDEMKYYYRQIKVFASINETGTGVTLNKTIEISRIQNPLNLRFEMNLQYFKPGVPYYGILVVTLPNGTKASDEPIQICSTMARERRLSDWWATRKIRYCGNYTSDENGICGYSVPPQTTDTVSVNLEAKALNYPTTQNSVGPTLYQPQTSTYLRPWYSPSGSHIQVQGIRNALPCGKTANIKVLYTATEEGTYKFHYEIVTPRKGVTSYAMDVNFVKPDEEPEEDCCDVTRGAEVTQIVPPPYSTDKEGVEDEGADDNNCKAFRDAKYVPMIGSFNISVDVSADESPSFYVVVFYVRDDREMVADSQKFEVEKCFNNKVELTFADTVKQPGSKTIMTLSSSPNSLCGIKVVDKSITLLDSSEQITKDNVFNALQRYNNGQNYARNHCQDKKVQPGLELKMASSSILPPRPWTPQEYNDAITAFENAGFLTISDFRLITRPCKINQQNYETYGGVAMPSMGIRGDDTALVSDDLDYDSPLTYAPPRPQAHNKLSTVAASAEMSSPARGGAAAGASFDANTATKSVVDVRTFFPETWLFDLRSTGDDGQYVKKEQLPHTITEWLGSAFCLNDNDGLGLSSEVAHIKGFQAFFVSFTLPYSMVRGEELTVIVTAFNYLDKCLPISLKLEKTDGYELLGDTPPMDVCLCGGKSESQQYVIKPTVLGTLNLTASGNNAADSDVCAGQETTDVIAKDALTNPLLIKPEGFPYVKVINALFCPKDAEGGTYKRQFQLELPEDVVKDSARAYVSISGDVMGSTLQNLDNLVQMPTGCGEQNMVTFCPIVSVLNYLKATKQLTPQIETKALKYLQSGYQRELNYRHSDGSYSAFGSRDKEGSIWLTAFVLRCFAEATKYIYVDDNVQKAAIDWILVQQNADGSFPEKGIILSHGIKGDKNASASALTAYTLTSLMTAGMKNTSVIDSALAFIASDETQDNDPYKLAQSAYCFALAGETAPAKEYLKKALSLAETTGEETFWRIKGSTTSPECLETASYVVLAQFELDYALVDILPLFRTLISARTKNGGFSSTQSTVMGLKALGKCAAALSGDPVALDITISDSKGFNEKVSFDENDKLLYKSTKIPNVPAVIDVEATGTGCGIIQGSVLCNTKTAHKEKYFDLNIVVERSADCKQATMTVTFRYIPDGKRSSMALLEINMLSGWAADTESLERAMNDDKVGLKRYDVKNNDLYLYYNEIGNQQMTLEIGLIQVFKVEKLVPATSKVYDYYMPDWKQETTYTMSECN